MHKRRTHLGSLNLTGTGKNGLFFPYGCNATHSQKLQIGAEAKMKSHDHQISNCLHLEVSRSRHRFSGSCAQVAVVQPLKLCPRLMLLTAKRDVSLPPNSVLIKNFLHLYVVCG
jgi:hypothetical protein